MAVSGGNAEKLIKPGYHLRPKYDLHGLRKRRSREERGQIAAELPLTAMIDMFSILVIYLLMNFSATGDAFFMAKPGIVLPSSGRAKLMSSAPLLSFTKGVYYLDALKPEGGILKIEDSTQNLSQVTAALEKLQLDIKRRGPEAFDGKLNLQADENTPLLYVKRAMGAATSAGWPSINFVVRPTASAP
jgi:biopolymer transport protein ExbD